MRSNKQKDYNIHSLHYFKAGIHLNILLNISNRYHHHEYSLWIDSRGVGRPQLARLIMTLGDAMLLMKTRMEWKSVVVGNCTPLIYHLLKVFNSSSFPFFFNHVCFEFVPIYMYVSSHYSISLDNLKSLYISHLISPTRLLLSVI